MQKIFLEGYTRHESGPRQLRSRDLLSLYILLYSLTFSIRILNNNHYNHYYVAIVKTRRLTDLLAFSESKWNSDRGKNQNFIEML